MTHHQVSLHIHVCISTRYAQVADIEMECDELRDQNRILTAKLSKEQARAEEADQKAAHYYKKWVEANRRNQMYRGSVTRTSSPPPAVPGRGGRVDISISQSELRNRMQRLEEQNARLTDENNKLLAAYRKLQGGGGGSGGGVGVGGGMGGAADTDADMLRRRIRELEDELERLRQRDLERNPGGQRAPHNPLQWELEAMEHEGREYLLDRRTGVLHVVDPATAGTARPWPMPVGRVRASRVLLLDLKDVASAFFGQLDRFLKEGRTRLDALFAELDKCVGGVPFVVIFP